MSRRLRLIGIGLSLSVVATPRAVRAEQPPDRVVIDRIVAVVGEQCVTQSELRRRARPQLARLAASEEGKGAKRAELEAALLREKLEAIVDERLVARVAAEKSIAVTGAEIDAALDSVAQANKLLSRSALLEEVRRVGVSEPEYREELRRQILEAKVVQVVVVPTIADRSALSDEAFRARIDAERKAFLARLRKRRFVEVRL